MRLPHLYFQKRCPHCASDRIRRTARLGYWENNIFPYMNAFPYRCEKCSHRMVMFIGRDAMHTHHHPDHYGDVPTDLTPGQTG